MPRIRCLYIDCVFLDDNFCTAPSVEIDPDLGCTTHSPIEGGQSDGKLDDDESLDDWNTEDIDVDDGGDVDDWLDEI